MRYSQRCLMTCIGLILSLTIHAQQAFFSHTIEKGETLTSIAKMYNTTISAITNANPGSSSIFKAGDILQIPTAKNNTTRSIYHTISQGETLYKLTKTYFVTAEELCKANPGLSETNFKTGSVIIIPVADANVHAKEDALKNNTPVLPKCREIHKVKRKETLYGIAHQYNISESELQDANPETLQPDFQLKKGLQLCIPYPRKKIVEPTNNEIFERIKPTPSGQKFIKLAVILPMEKNTAKDLRMIEFYQGILFAVDSIKKQGVSLEVYGFDAGKTATDIKTLLIKGELKKMDIIFAPPSTTQISILSNFCKANSINLIVPFTSSHQEIFNNPYFFQVNMPKEYLYAEVCNEFIKKFKNSNVIFWNAETNTNKSDFVLELRKVISNSNIETRDLMKSSDTNMLLEAMNKGKDNIIILNSDTKETLTQIYPLLKKFKTNHPAYKVHLFGYPDWQAYSYDIREKLCNLDSYIFTFYSTSSETVALINKTFRYWFKKPMINTSPRFGLYGFDLGYYFLKAISLYGKDLTEDELNKMNIKPYQTPIKFERTSNWGGFMNKKILFLHYTPYGEYTN